MLTLFIYSFTTDSSVSLKFSVGLYLVTINLTLFQKNATFDNGDHNNFPNWEYTPTYYGRDHVRYVAIFAKHSLMISLILASFWSCSFNTFTLRAAQSNDFTWSVKITPVIG